MRRVFTECRGVEREQCVRIRQSKALLYQEKRRKSVNLKRRDEKIALSG